VTLRVGILGAGQVGERHAIGFSQTEGAQIVGFADLVEERATALASRFGGKPYTDWRRLIDAGVDIVVVGLPHNNHVAPTEAAAAAGAHVLMEKPIATNLADAQRIVEVCQRAGVKLTMSFVHRYRDELQRARSWIAEGLIGTPQVGAENFNSQRGPHLGRWITNKEIAGGGVLMYGAIHGVDRFRWLMDSEIVEVTAHTHRWDPESEVEDSAIALFRFANGATGTLLSYAPIYRAQPAYWETQIYGTQGMLRLRVRGWAEVSNNGVMKREDSTTAKGPLGEHYNFVRQAQEFVAAIREDREPAITAQDGLASLRVCLAVYESAETGKTIRLAL
jgi:predicted dehydrogenase